MKRATVSRLMLVLLAAAVTAYAAWSRYVTGIADRAAALAAQIEEQKIGSERSRQARTLLGELGPDEAAVGAYFVSTQDIVAFLESLEQVGTTLGTDVEVVSVAAVTQPRERLNLSLRISGTFDSVLRTLGAIEYGPHDIELQSLTFDTAAAGPGGLPGWTAAATFAVGTATTTTRTP